MIETEHVIQIDAPIAEVWDYVRDMRRWADILPGCKDYTVVDQNDSRWTVKVGAGGLVRTVNVSVHVDRWAGPERVDFSYKLDAEPVVGSGSYVASPAGPGTTAVALKLLVGGSGPMAPMWEAVSKPLIPQLAKAFAAKLKARIEEAAGAPAAKAAAAIGNPTRSAAIGNRLRKLWRGMLAWTHG